MIHLYVSRQYARMRSDIESDRVKLLCTKRWIGYEGTRYYANAVTVADKVTCPNCLEILIPIANEKLDRMKRAYLLFKEKEPKNDSLLHQTEVSRESGKDALRGGLGSAAASGASALDGRLPGMPPYPNSASRKTPEGSSG